MKNRQIFSKIWAEIDSPNVIVLNGPRQVGKSTLMRMLKGKLLADKNISETDIHFFDLEKTEDLELWQDQTKVLARLLPLGKQRQYIFIDEFQLSPSIGSTFKVLHDHYSQFKCIATGSVSWSVVIEESMAGRKRVFNIWPLSFAEFIDWVADEKSTASLRLAKNSPLALTAAEITGVNEQLNNYLSYGGYPSAVNVSTADDKIAALNELVDSYISRDIERFNRAVDPVQTRKLLTLLASASGTLLDVTHLSVNSGLGRVALLSRLGWMEQAFLVRMVRPYYTNKIKELIKNPKFFLTDIGLANLLLKNHSVVPATTNYGRLAENFVANELFKSVSAAKYTLNYWRTKTGVEIDLVIGRANNFIPVEIKGGECPSVPKNILSFIKEYHPTVAYVLNLSVVKNETVGGCEVRFRPLWSAYGIVDEIGV